MDEFEGTCAGCQRTWRLAVHPDSERVRPNSFNMHCPFCQVTAPNILRNGPVAMKRTPASKRIMNG